MPSRRYLLSSICLFVILVSVFVQAQSLQEEPTPRVLSKLHRLPEDITVAKPGPKVAKDLSGAAQAWGLNFAPAVVYSSGTGDVVTAVAISDLNGDGNPDVVAAGGDLVAVLLGNGDGTLESDGDYDSGGNGSEYQAYDVAVADLNGDGRPDIVVANAAGLVGVLLGNGDGTFGRPTQSYGSGGWGSSSVAVADVNSDGKPDLIVSNGCVSFSDCSKGSVGILLGNGDGTFQPAITYSPGGLFVGSLVAADVNNDGRSDVLVSVCTSVDTDGACQRGGVAVLLGKGDGTFRRPLLQSLGLYAGLLAVADVNGDGKPDLVAAKCILSPGCVGVAAVLLGNGDGTFARPSYLATGAGSMVATDVNGDGKLDLVFSTSCLNCADGYNGAVGVLLGNGNGKFQPAVTFSSGGYRAGEVAVADLNGDGKPDIVVTTCDNTLCVPNPEIGVLINTSVPAKRTALTSSPNPPDK
ncbi:MAG TPA: VCBS repeat-containing protein [Candidatus Sulfotelmatobacter sp.]|jgi:hypothetical protein